MTHVPGVPLDEERGMALLALLSKHFSTIKWIFGSKVRRTETDKSADEFRRAQLANSSREKQYVREVSSSYSDSGWHHLYEHE